MVPVAELPAIELWLRAGYLYDHRSHVDEFVWCQMMTVKAVYGRCLEFQVLTENGVLRDKLPVQALCIKKDAPTLPLGQQELWDCPSDQVFVYQMSRVGRMQLWLPNKKQLKGNYLFTCDFIHTGSHTLDIGESLIPSEHKAKHIIAGDDGNLYAYPNNRALVMHSTMTTNLLKSNPGYKVCSEIPSVENGCRLGGDPDDYMYGA